MMVANTVRKQMESNKQATFAFYMFSSRMSLNLSTSENSLIINFIMHRTRHMRYGTNLYISGDGFVLDQTMCKQPQQLD